MGQGCTLLLGHCLTVLMDQGCTLLLGHGFTVLMGQGYTLLMGQQLKVVGFSDKAQIFTMRCPE